MSMTTTSVSNWYGTDRTIADKIGDLLRGCAWVGVPFAGGMSALARIPCQQGVASDLHAHVINLATVIANPAKREELMDRLATMPLHDGLHLQACWRCTERENAGAKFVNDNIDLFGTAHESRVPDYPNELGDVDWAMDYFIVSWMGRGSTCGQEDEFDSGISVRWKAGGGGSSQRWRSAVESIPAWGDVLKRWTFISMDVFEFLAKVAKANKAPAKSGLYLDPPFPGPGDLYKHRFSERNQLDLARQLHDMRNVRIVVRFYDHPLIRNLYPEDDWTWHRLVGRTQTNGEAAEVLLVRSA